jgi:hypothetical protein
MLQPFSISISSILKTNVKFILPAIIQTIINVDENSDTGERKINADPRRLTHADQDPEHCSKPKSPTASIMDQRRLMPIRIRISMSRYRSALN